MSLKAIPVHKIPYLSLVLVEPTIATPEVYYRTIAAHTPALVETTMMRRGRWRSRSDAAAWLQRRAPWKRWDPRALNLFTASPILPLPTAP
jgi:hypothetical protein